MASEPARLPPELPGLDPAWSQLTAVEREDGSTRTFHVLVRPAKSQKPRLTVLCVHGNPSWSYLWRRVLASAPPTVRVIAPDHLNMGFSERTGIPVTLAERIEDLARIAEALEVKGPVITLAHDWGGPISLGWAQRNVQRLHGVALTNTAVSQPPGNPAPWLIRLAGNKALISGITERTKLFVRTGLRLSTPEPDAATRAAFIAPYDTRERRAGIRDFVADIPLEPTHASFGSLEQVATGLERLKSTPTLLLWGTSDPVFTETYLHDLEQRMPHADVHRFVGASHFVTEDAPVEEAFWDWVGALEQPRPAAPPSTTLNAAERSLQPGIDAASPLVTEWASDRWRSVDRQSFVDRVDRVARGLHAIGVSSGDRVSLMIPPGIDLTTALYAIWRMDVTAVLIDSGLGINNMRRAATAANSDWLIGIPTAIVAAKALRWPGRRIVVGEMDDRLRSALGVERSLRQIEFLGEGNQHLGEAVDGNLGGSQNVTSPVPAAIGFTSGSTGPSKPVMYLSEQLAAQRDAIRDLYAITAADRLVAAFAPFALYGPALGIGSVVPDMDVTNPSTLTATALAAAVDQVGATIVFASPASLRNVIATASSLTAPQKSVLSAVRLLMSAGAPVPLEVLQSVAAILPSAEIHTPYGMTELLPVADISLAVRLARGPGLGTCVGRPLPGVDVRVEALDEVGGSTGRTAELDQLGEVVVRAAHMKVGYDRLWWTDFRSTTRDGWHRTGDVGSIDHNGFLWISGRVQHMIITASGPVPPVPLEHAAETVPDVALAAAVGVGPAGSQVPVVVVQSKNRHRRPLANHQLATAIRSAVADANLIAPAGILVADIPVDRRHNSKVDRARVQRWADAVMAGKRPLRM